MNAASVASPPSLAGQIALVTGATCGIGRATAFRLAAEGVAVCVTGRNAERGNAITAEIEAAGGKSLYMSLDVVDFAATERAVARDDRPFRRPRHRRRQCRHRHGRNRGRIDLSEWREMMDVNFFGTANLVKAALRPMLAQGRGTVIAIASSAATTGYAEWGGYCASKWAVAGFMECLGREMVDKGIRTCTICPGSVDTPFWDDLNQDLHRAGTPSRAAMMSAEDVAEIVLLQLRLPQTVLIKQALTFPTNEWH